MTDRFISNKIPAKLLPKDINGNTCCRWCNIGVKPPRRTFCSPDCVHEYRIRTSGRYIRDCVYSRDKGICSLCNIDTKKTAKELLENNKQELYDKYMITSKRKIWKKKHGGGLWDADHIIPVKEGGGQCGLDNIRTLCIVCHKKVTKNLYSKENILNKN